MTLRPSCGILPVLSLLALVQLHFTASGTGTSEFSILPNSDTPCPMRLCYTLSQVMDNSSNYITSNTTVVFPPGHHEASTEGQLVIQNVNNISLVGDNDNSTTIKCVGQFGLAFINITNLTVSKLHFSMCGAPMSWPAFHLSHITNLTATKFGISHSKGKGLLAVNIVGVSSIQQAVFVNNTPNCVILFEYSDSSMETPVLHITDSLFMFGVSDDTMLAGGLNVVAIQPKYHIRCYIRNVTAYDNIGVINGNMLFKINCKVAIQVTQVSCTGGHIKGLVLEFENDFISCNSFEITSHFYMSDSHFDRNDMGVSLSFAYIYYYVSVQLKNITVENNSQALEMYINHYSVSLIENVNVTHNMGPVLIMAMEESSKVEFHGSNTFADNNCKNSSYATLHLMHDCHVTFYGTTTFRRNKGNYGAICANNAEINIQGNIRLLNNEAEYGGALILHQSNVSVLTGQFAEVSFVGNHAQESGGAVYAIDSQIIIKSGQKLLFVENKGYDGGAITLTGESIIYLGANSSITFTRNHAYHYGGAIYYVDDYNEDFEPAAERIKCFYGILGTEDASIYLRDAINYIKEKHIAFELYNNTAGFAGAAIYGGSVSICNFYVNHQMISWYEPEISAFDSLFDLHQPTQQLSLIASNPTRICLCTNTSIPDCSIIEYSITTYPGETFTIPGVAVGQKFGTVPFITVHSNFVSTDNGRLPELQYTQLVNANCTNLTYTILSSPSRTEVIKLTVEKHSIPQNRIINKALEDLQVTRTLITLQFSELTMHVDLKPCPLAFVFDKNSQTCICSPKLQQQQINCSIDTQTVYRRSPLWINATFLNETYTQILVHNHCPFDYCKDGNIQLNMEYPDEQCAFYRSGVLCGSCQQNLSHVLGTSNCKECSSNFLLLIPVFIVAGIALVAFLMLLNLTVSVGTINGLIFYANIVRANHAIFFPHGTNNQFLSIFVAWLNLDLGIETCFYSGLDAYAKTWLQFLFPVYIWIIVLLIIISSHYSTTAAKLSGRNAVQVLATLFLLSYAKLLRVTITAFSSTLLEYPDGSVKRIWLYDGNVDYLKGKHIALFAAALLLLLFISLPYTVALLFIQCLQYRSRYRILAWVRKLKPLFDAYTGPYKDTHRYWPGLLLVVRVVLFLVFSVNVFGDPAVSLLTIIVTTFCMNYFTITIGGVYKSSLLNMIEYSFFLNLGILSSATLFTTLTDGDQTAVVYTSVGIAFTTFMIITIYHILVRVTKEQQRQRFTEWATAKQKAINPSVKTLYGKKNNRNNCHQPTNHNPLIELREPLLDSAN